MTRLAASATQDLGMMIDTGRMKFRHALRRTGERNRGYLRLLTCFFLLACPPISLVSQAIPAKFSFPGRFMAAAEGMGMGGGGEVDPSAWRLERFTRVSFFTTASSLGVGEQMSTNLSPHFDARVFGNLISVTTDRFSERDTKVAVNLEFANMGAAADYYPIHKPLRLSAGYLFYNANRIRADVQAGQDAVLTMNDTDFYSDNANPVHGTGRATLGGGGFLLTTGYGRIVSRSDNHFSFPFEAGVAFIDTPKVAVNLLGNLCSADGTNCQPTATYPGFEEALAAQVAKWNKNASPYHIYPIIQGGVAYTFRIRKSR